MPAVTDMNLHPTGKSHAAALEAHFELVQTSQMDSRDLGFLGQVEWCQE